MLAFLRANIGLIIGTILFFGFVLGGIYYVEHSLASQVQVIE
ncbi:hypothetical protein [Shewanella marina]|nr:hypothetical protein [Shewanella marina]